MIVPEGQITEGRLFCTPLPLPWGCRLLPLFRAAASCRPLAAGDILR